MNKKVKKYLLYDGDAADFLVEAKDINDATQLAKQMKMTVRAAWFERSDDSLLEGGCDNE